jgi:N6-adenosine-specific RNA methylase IME4
MSPTGLPNMAFDVVVADPPWAFAVYGANGHGKSPEAHYPTMDMEAIAALRLGDLLRPGGILLLWGTGPLLLRQGALLERWGLTYVSFAVWAKRTASGRLRWGPGYRTRTVCEPILMGVSPGDCRREGRWNGARFPNLLEDLGGEKVDGLAREHSRKPDEFYALVEAATPGATRADLFARQTRPGWTSWGNEVGRFDNVVPFGRMAGEGWG